MKQQRAPQEFDEKVIKIGRVSKKTKGGNHMSFTALVVVGDRKSRVGVALGKASDVMHAIQKGVKKAKKHLITVPLRGTTLPHELNVKFGSAKVVMKPAPLGTGVIAGGSVRSVLELAGVKDVVAKTLGTANRLTNVTATFEALKKMAEVVRVKQALGQMKETKQPIAATPTATASPEPVTPTAPAAPRKPAAKKPVTKKVVKKAAK